MNTSQIARKIEQLKRQLAQLGPKHPGSLSAQYNVCGKPSCRCKDPKEPQKHGPYYQLSFTWRGKSRTRFVRAERLAGHGAAQLPVAEERSGHHHRCPPPATPRLRTKNPQVCCYSMG